MESQKQEIILLIRGCLVSTKGRITLKELQDIYLGIVGEHIPFKKLGFKSLEAFLESIPSLLISKGVNNQIFVDARPSSNSVHISQMVQKQKPAKKKGNAPKTKRYFQQPPQNFARARRPPMQNYQNHNYAPAAPQPSIQRPTQIYKYSPDTPQPNNHAHHPADQMMGFAPAAGASARLVRHQQTTNNTPVMSQQFPQSNGDKFDEKPDELWVEEEEDFEDGDSDSDHPEYIPTGDTCADLKTFVEMFKLTPLDITFTENKPKKSKTTIIYCKIMIKNQWTYLSYPSDSLTKQQAEEIAAKKALDDLVSKYSNRPSSTLISDYEDIIERIPLLMEKCHTAVWMWDLESEYLEKYNEHLPFDWIKIVDNLPMLAIEKYAGKCVLRRCDPKDILQKFKKLDMDGLDVTVPYNVYHFGKTNRMHAVILWAPDVSQVWCQQCNVTEFDSFNAMMEEMNSFYNNHHRDTSLIPPEIRVDYCYAIKIEKKLWIRVKTVERTEKSWKCFALDLGREYTVPVNEIYVLRREFTKIQAQAFLCRLVNLEDLYEISCGSPYLQDLENREVIVENKSEEDKENLVPDDPTLPIGLYDINTGKSINRQLVALLSAPVLQKNSVNEVYVSHIEPDGICFVQCRTPAYHKLMELMSTLPLTINEKTPKNVVVADLRKEFCENRLFLVKTGNGWVRGKFVDWSQTGGFVEIFCVDYGNSIAAKLGKEMIYPLDKVDRVLNEYAAQAIKVRILMDSLPMNFVEKAAKHLPKDEMVLCTVVKVDNADIPCVEFSKKKSTNGIGINRLIAMEPDLEKPESPTEDSSSKVKKRLMALIPKIQRNTSPEGSLAAPKIPPICEYFNVKVPFAVHPWNFFVQPLESLHKLTAMMAEMQIFYNSNTFSPLTIDDLVPEKVYVSRHDDGMWYRTRVVRVVNLTSISASYCDFGYYKHLTFRDLVPLAPQFKNLPYQGLKAKLADVKPAKNKVRVEDCDLFKKLVTGHEYVSVIKNIERDELDCSDIVLNLHLIDTTGTKDVHVKAVLIEKGVAVPVM